MQPEYFAKHRNLNLMHIKYSAVTFCVCLQARKLNYKFLTAKGTGKCFNIEGRNRPAEKELCDLHRSRGVVRVVKCGRL